jgi:hypothetical protein
MVVASAPVPVSSDSNVTLVLVSAGVVLGVGLMGLILVQVARSRGRQKRDVLMAMLVIWGLLTAGSISVSVMQQMDWSATLQQRISSGYYDPNNVSDQPKLPIPLWCGLGAAYAGMMLWAAVGKPTTALR